MERERKRKTGEVKASGASVRRKEEAENSKSAAPTEDEVEEFFAILRRMHVAVKYFEESNVGVDGREMTLKLEASLGKEALEAAAAATSLVVVDENEDEGAVKKRSIGGFDLNSVPEGESSILEFVGF